LLSLFEKKAPRFVVHQPFGWSHPQTGFDLRAIKIALVPEIEVTGVNGDRGGR
jgi:hypothetical protein